MATPEILTVLDRFTFSKEVSAALGAIQTENPQEVLQASEIFLNTLDPLPGKRFFVELNTLAIAVRGQQERMAGPMREYAPPAIFVEAMTAAYEARFSDLGFEHRQAFSEAILTQNAGWVAADQRDRDILARETKAHSAGIRRVRPH